MFLLGPNEERLFAHKLFLMTASPIFHQILSQEADNDGMLTVKINQISKNAMIEVCRYAYTDAVNFTQNNVLEILHVASKLEMRHLMEKAIEYAGKQINENSVFLILAGNERYRHWQINKKCFDFIQKNYQKCLRTKSWMKVTPDLMRLICSNCKIPQSVAKDPLSAWAKNLGDSFDELEEMMSMLSLNKEETVVAAPSKAEGKSAHKVPERIRKKMENKPPSGHELVLRINGPRNVQNFCRAGLSLENGRDNITIKKLDFIYDLVTSDTEFILQVFVIDSQQQKIVPIYKEPVKITSSCKFLTLRGKCELRAGQKFRIQIEFPFSTMRPSFVRNNASPMSSDLKIFDDPIAKMSNLTSQIFSIISYAK